jgi:curved DNA-binding protein CbpA
MNQSQDYYAILGVLPAAEDVVIRAAYRALSQKYHPDKLKGERADAARRMQQLNEAYEVLSNASKREQYDRERSGNTNDDFDFSDDSMRSAFREAETEQEADWSLALEYYPDLTDRYKRLSKVSEKLAFEFRSALLASKEFARRDEIANALENGFLQRYFGTNPTVVEFARELIKSGNKKAAKELNRAVTVLGSNGDPELIIGRIRGKFILFQQTAERELCTEESLNLLRDAVAVGYTLTVDNRNIFTLSKNSSNTHLHSNFAIKRMVPILIRASKQ